jgi:hypothetical protein
MRAILTLASLLFIVADASAQFCGRDVRRSREVIRERPRSFAPAYQPQFSQSFSQPIVIPIYIDRPVFQQQQFIPQYQFQPQYSQPSFQYADPYRAPRVMEFSATFSEGPQFAPQYQQPVFQPQPQFVPQFQQQFSLPFQSCPNGRCGVR